MVSFFGLALVSAERDIVIWHVTRSPIVQDCDAMIPLTANKQGQGSGVGAGWALVAGWLSWIVCRHTDQNRSMVYWKGKQSLGNSVVEVCETH